MNNTKQYLENAQKIMAPYWPLTSFIATNHLWDLRDENFFELQNTLPIQYLPNKSKKNLLKKNCVVLYAEQVGAQDFAPLSETIKEKICGILSRHYSLKNDDSIFTTWKADDTKNADHMPTDNRIFDTINQYANTLNIPLKLRTQYFQRIYIALYGWSSFSKWVSANKENPWIKKETALNHIILIWLFYEVQAYQNTHIAYASNTKKQHSGKIDSSKDILLQKEKQYALPIVEALNSDKPLKTPLPKAQFIFCIDTRSEGIRRQLESLDHYETFGAAGFFGVIFELIQKKHHTYQSPALIKPVKKIQSNKPKTHKRKWIHQHIKQIVDAVRHKSTASLALFEIAGIYYLFYMLYKTLFPLRKTHDDASRNHYTTDDFTLEEKSLAGANFLKSIDLQTDFSTAVIICGHQTDVSNNPFQTALNCGACGGNEGAPNATIMAEILNNASVRQCLFQEHDILIPKNTIFYAATHHTVLDRIEFLSDKPSEEIIGNCARAGDALQHEKTADYPFLDTVKNPETNWSEIIPELGLINNAGFIIGPRSLSKHINLKRRTFLQSYNPENDTDAEILTSIFSGPCVVAHWINMQYFLSSTNPSLFGAGNKAIHNVIPSIGVIEGNLSDLKIGLPLQSTHFHEKLLHEPLRLTYFVNAKQSQINLALKQSPDFNLLVKNEWVNLIQIEPKNHDTY